MFLKDEEVASRLSNDKNLALRKNEIPRRQIEDLSERKEIRHEKPEEEEDSTVLAPLHNGGRRPGDKNLPEFMRSIIGATANLDTLENTAEAFGVSVHHAHELKHGKHSNAQGQNDQLVDEINQQLRTPHDLAVERLTQALLQITPEKIQAQKSLKSIVKVAAGLSNIAKNTAPIQKETGDSKEAKLIVYAPTFKQEVTYDTVQVGSGKTSS